MAAPFGALRSDRLAGVEGYVALSGPSHRMHAEKPETLEKKHTLCLLDSVPLAREMMVIDDVIAFSKTD